jgi:hypothetical protein
VLLIAGFFWLVANIERVSTSDNVLVALGWPRLLLWYTVFLGLAVVVYVFWLCCIVWPRTSTREQRQGLGGGGVGFTAPLGAERYSTPLLDDASGGGGGGGTRRRVAVGAAHSTSSDLILPHRL